VTNRRRGRKEERRSTRRECGVECQGEEMMARDEEERGSRTEGGGREDAARWRTAAQRTRDR